VLYGDFESRSEVELSREKSVGMYNYATHPTTQPLMFGYALDEDKPKMWRIWDGEPMPVEVRERLDDPKEPLCFFNSTFERYLFNFKLGVEIDINRIADPQVSCRYLSLPGDLEEASDILGLDRDLGKDKRGKELINLFSKLIVKKAKKPTKKNPDGVPERCFFNDWNSHPAEWQEFCDYCMQDVVAEREVLRILEKFRVYPLPEREHRLWVFDQKVNDRGIPVDVQFVKNAYALASRAKEEAIKRQNELTGLENANSNEQLLGWAKQHGYEPNSLRKDTVNAALKYSTTLSPICREVLTARKTASSTTYKKLAAILRQVCPDGRLRNMFVFFGSSRCGRWSGNAVQIQNLARPEEKFENDVVMDRARQLVKDNDYDSLVKEFGSVLAVVKNVIRTVFSVEREFNEV
jgi:DNA polymerase